VLGRGASDVGRTVRSDTVRTPRLPRGIRCEAWESFGSFVGCTCRLLSTPRRVLPSPSTRGVGWRGVGGEGLSDEASPPKTPETPVDSVINPRLSCFLSFPP
jgi:hypothetical protein